jgi:stearoyl-CoA desaturase (delta-9 desaturase)
MLYGLFHLSFWGYVIVTLAFTQLTILGVTLYLHRNQTHRGVDLHPIVSHIFRLWLWLSTGMRTKEWVAVHRKHHATVETADDPHSPVIYGIRELMWRGAELYRRAANNAELVTKYGAGTPNDIIERNLYSLYPKMGLGVMLILDVILFGVPGITIWAIQMMWIPLFAAGVINGLGHYIGYRNFEVPDASRNIMPWGFFLGGEELHNNHHTYGSSAKFSVKWWEFDMGWLVIRVLSWFGLAKVRRVHNLPVETDTVKALFSSRFQLLAHYYKSVTLPVFRAEKQLKQEVQPALFRHTRKLLLRDPSLLDQGGQTRLEKLLAYCEQLKVVYQYRLMLQNVWSRGVTNPKELLESVQQWCQQAEASGVLALRNFAQELQTWMARPA